MVLSQVAEGHFLYEVIISIVKFPTKIQNIIQSNSIICPLKTNQVQGKQARIWLSSVRILVVHIYSSEIRRGNIIRTYVFHRKHIYAQRRKYASSPIPPDRGNLVPSHLILLCCWSHFNLFDLVTIRRLNIIFLIS